jgi:hypothetical protein
MFMTTESWSKLRRVTGVLAIIHFAILLTYATLTLVPGAAKAALVIRPTPELINHLSSDIRILKWNKWSLQVTSTEPDFVQSLYRSGAILVLPVRKSGCLQPQSNKVQN